MRSAQVLAGALRNAALCQASTNALHSHATYKLHSQVLVQSRAALGRSGTALAVKSWMRDLSKLAKGKLSLIVTITAGAGFAAGSGETVDYGKMACTAVGTLACAAAANALNQVYEVKNDGLMQRTMLRPLPAGRLTTRHALTFAALTGFAGTVLLGTQVWPIQALPLSGCVSPSIGLVCTHNGLSSLDSSPVHLF
jgi:heme O synthase-like polyprenyltransferase